MESQVVFRVVFQAKNVPIECGPLKVSLNTNDVARTAGIELNELVLTEEEVRMLEELNGDEELAAPPSSEEVFGEKVVF